ncbi:MAG: DUF501 domain-containing protein [bacterium]
MQKKAKLYSKSHRDKITQIIEKQIGRKPRNLLKVIKKCRYKLPRVILSSPELSPTIFWLTCPHEIYLISRLESDGLIKKIKNKFIINTSLKENIITINKNFAGYRKKFYPPGLSIKRVKSLEGKGIDGIKDLSSLKCLHSHWAYHIAVKKNPIGNIIEGYVKKNPLCKKKCVYIT